MGILSLIPVLWLIIALVAFKIPGHIACMTTLLIAGILSLFFWEMPFIEMSTSAIEGFATALWPIILVIIAAMFAYNLSVRSGSMAKIKEMMTGISKDQRVQILLIGWCFGGFLEGMAGFGTAVAIPASILVSMGMAPIPVALACMVANAFPTAFGSVGIPTVTLSTVTGLDVFKLSHLTGFQGAPFMFFIPFIMVFIIGGGIKAFRGMFIITLVSSLAFIVPQFFVAKYLGPELPVMVGSACALIATIFIAKIKDESTIEKAYNLSLLNNVDSKQPVQTATMSPFLAWLPFILIFLLLLATSKFIPFINSALSSFSSSIQISTSSNAAPVTFTWINTPGIWIILAALIFSVVAKIPLKIVGDVFVTTIKNLSKTIITIMSILAAAKIMTFSGMISDMANLFVSVTGQYYVFVAPIISTIGAFITGSGTSTTVLFGKLQTEAAMEIGVSPYWIAVANTLGACIGKIMSPQLIATAAAAINMTGQESVLLKGIIKWVLLLLFFACLWVGLGITISPF